ncbi:diguanylate cyclase [Alteromonas hispanica]|uniref:diguanylate cyclase n=1 Tax=Alteromonas hispanica TaxID=315421 RepID=A0A6L9MSF4_9ALTE|nr:diguanylate cyclase [Alteromonas hispanica]
MSISSVSIFVKASLLLLIYIPSLVFASSLQNGDAEKINRYANLTHAVLYEWNYPSELSNEDILQQLKQSKLQSDKSDISVVFRHVIALSNAQQVDAPKVPVVIKEVLLDRHWQALKRADIKTYAFLKAYHIYIKGFNDFKGSVKRLSSTVPALYSLKNDLLRSGNKVAIITVSMWIASELIDTAPIQAINEIEFALPHLPIEPSGNKLVMEINLVDAHNDLADLYLNLNVPTKSAEHAKKFISLKRQYRSLETTDFLFAISTLNRLGKFDEALELIEEARDSAPVDDHFESVFLDMFEMSVYGSRLREGDKAKLTELSTRVLNSSVLFPNESADIKPTANAIYNAVNGNDEEFNYSILQLEEAFEKKYSSTPLKNKAVLNRYLILKHIYNIRGDIENAFSYQEKYQLALLNSHGEKFQSASGIKLDLLSKDIELAEYRQKELLSLQQEKVGLTGDKANLRTAVFALIAVICLMITSWLWLAKKQSDKQANTDSLTGALTRRAMLRQLKALLKRHPSSCLALLDIDHFKRINDKYGHAVGDEVLSTFSDIIRQRIRKSDLVCRYGGEEFLIYFEHSTEQEVTAILDELNNSFSSKTNWSTTNKAFTVSFSSGVVALNGTTNSESVIKLCDDLLYKAKNRGRSRVESTTLAHSY